MLLNLALTHTYYLYIKMIYGKKSLNFPPNGQKVISLYLQCQDLKGTRRDFFNTETVYQLILLIKNIDTPISLDSKNIYIYESAFTACIVNFVAFFSDSKMHQKFNPKNIFLAEKLEIFNEFKNIRNKILAHREYYKSDLILFNLNQNRTQMFVDPFGHGENYLFLFAKFREDLLIQYLLEISQIFIKHINDEYIKKTFHLQDAINSDLQIFKYLGKQIPKPSNTIK